MRMAYGGPNPMNMPGFCAAGDSFNETRMNVRDGIFFHFDDGRSRIRACECEYICHPGTYRTLLSIIADDCMMIHSDIHSA